MSEQTKLWIPAWTVIPVDGVPFGALELERAMHDAAVPTAIAWRIDREGAYERKEIPPDYGHWPVPHEQGYVCVVATDNPDYQTRNAAGLAWPSLRYASCIYNPATENYLSIGLRIWHEVLHCLLGSGEPDQMTKSSSFIAHLEEKFGYNDPFTAQFRADPSTYAHDPTYQREFYIHLAEKYFWDELYGSSPPPPPPPERPAAAFWAELSGTRAPFTARFTNLSTNGDTWLWDFGDGTTSTATHPTHTYAKSGTYTVTLAATNSHGTSNASRLIEFYVRCADPDGKLGDERCDGYSRLRCGDTGNWDVVEYTAASCGYPRPTATFSADVSGTNAPFTAKFTDHSTGSPTAWLWDFGDGHQSSEQHPTHTYTADGVYTVYLAVSNTSGHDTTTRDLEVRSTCTSPFGYHGAEFCDGYTRMRCDQGTWTTHEANAYTCGFRDPDAPLATFTASVTGGPVPLAVQFHDTSTGSPTTWYWNFGDNTTSFERHPVHTYDTEGTYLVTLTASSAYGSTTAQTTIHAWEIAPAKDRSILPLLGMTAFLGLGVVATSTKPPHPPE